ncbi:DNA-directed RNA polymerases II, IV and V subunit [Sesamum angolense]|uniref:DNA-directed RNA polymerases II, IV and V subunit n=1 Tax=Sesamum angolense TaxID=2727404 RepID=A0AAE1WS35_9LAMI|nr:DNA-directed RNA polymerases II, IV and V subunit [Sesamum angolense]
MDSQPEPVSYICGDCGQENTLKPGDVIQCRECGYRILYKKRTRRISGDLYFLQIQRFKEDIDSVVVRALNESRFKLELKTCTHSFLFVLPPPIPFNSTRERETSVGDGDSDPQLSPHIKSAQDDHHCVIDVPGSEPRSAPEPVY